MRSRELVDPGGPVRDGVLAERGVAVIDDEGVVAYECDSGGLRRKGGWASR